MNYKKQKIREFIEKDLRDNIENIFQKIYKEEAKKNYYTKDLEKETYDHLINFFSRYYKNGVLINREDNNLCVPIYKDQYYIKTMEYFKKYSFSIDDLHIRFKMATAKLEKGNLKSSEKKFFILNKKIFDYDKEKKELDIYFDYRTLTDEEKSIYGVNQRTINSKVEDVLKENLSNTSTDLFKRKGKNSSIIKKHINKYTKKQELDYFIHKDLKRFLEKGLDRYIKDEMMRLEDLEKYGAERLEEIKEFKEEAGKIIDVLSKIEDEQKRLWEKKKEPIKINYVITLDRIKRYTGEGFLESIIDEVLKNELQINEWKELFDEIIKERKDLIQKTDLEGIDWKRLPLDTKYFSSEFKKKLIDAINKENNINEIIDGELIKSENYQGLVYLMDSYKGKVQTIYIDPPFNKGKESDYLYKVGYKDATWVTMLENRIRLARYLLNERGSIFVRCDYRGNMYVRLLLDEVFGEGNFRNEVVISRTKTALYIGTPKKLSKNLGPSHDNIYWYSKILDTSFPKISKGIVEIKRNAYWKDLKSFYDRPKYRYELFGILPEKGCSWVWKKEEVLTAIENYNKFTELYQNKLKKIEETSKIIQKYLGEGTASAFKRDIENSLIESYCNKTGKTLRFIKKGKNTFYYWIEPIQRVSITDWTSIEGYSRGWGFSTENSEILLKRVIESTSNEGNLVLDFFLGSGTTTAVAHKLKRKWIGIEMGEHFYSIIMPRMKKVLYYDKSEISKEKDVKEKYNPKTAGGFFKYHTLEQYEDALENIEFEKSQTETNLLNFANFFVKYMLDWETKSSKTFLNIDEMKNPFNYKLKILENYQQKDVNVDLIETFNYLLGLQVNKYKTLEANERKYIFVFGENKGRKTTIVWRNVENIDFEKDKEIIEKHIKEFDPDELYVNRDAVVKGFKPIESEFKSLMFEEVD